MGLKLRITLKSLDLLAISNHATLKMSFLAAVQVCLSRCAQLKQQYLF